MNNYVPNVFNTLLKYRLAKMNLNFIKFAHYDFDNNSKKLLRNLVSNIHLQKKNLERLNNINVNLLYYTILRDEYKNK